MGQPGKKSHKGLTIVLVLCWLLGLCVLGGVAVIGGALKDTAKSLPAALASAMPSGLPVAPATTATAGPLQGDGKWLVPSEVKPGTYRATVPADSLGCYYARLRDTDDGPNSIISNNIVAAGGTATMTVKSTDKAVEVKGCGAWVKAG